MADEPQDQDQDQAQADEPDEAERFFTRLDERLRGHSQQLLDDYLARVSELLGDDGKDDDKDKTKEGKEPDGTQDKSSDAAAQREGGRRRAGFLDGLYGRRRS